MANSETFGLWDRELFVETLRTLGMSRYHHEHPFHRAMNEGRLTREQLRGWVANRFHYQRHIPLKDAAILSNCPDREVRRIWIHRLTDHDGRDGEEGGLEAWLRLAQGVELTREHVLSGAEVLPGTRFAVEAYVTFTRTEPWPIAVASSLTELFAPDLMKERLAAFEKYYSWIPSGALDYFRRRVTQARKDSGEGLELVLAHCTTRELQERAVRALSFKCDLLWAMLDAIALAYGIGTSVPPSGPPAGEGRPDGKGTRDEQKREEDKHVGQGIVRLVRRARLRGDPVTGKPTLLFPEGMMILNATGEAIVRLCDGKRTARDIVASLATRYKVSPEALESDVTQFLGRLRDRQLVELDR
jgi:pyrroloquinoline-quinone synthase